MQRHFHAELEALKQTLLAMGGLVEEQIRRVMSALLERDVVLAQEVIDRDRQVRTAVSARSRRWPSSRASTRILSCSSGLLRSRGPCPGYFGSIAAPTRLRVAALDRRVGRQRIEVRSFVVAPVHGLAWTRPALPVRATPAVAAALAFGHHDVAQPLALLATPLVARLLVVGVLLGETEDARIVALALEAAQCSLERLVRADLDANHVEGSSRRLGQRIRRAAPRWRRGPTSRIVRTNPNRGKGERPYRIAIAGQSRACCSCPMSAEPERDVTVLGTIERFTFRNPDTGWAVVRLLDEAAGRPITAVGSMAQLTEGQRLKITGRSEERR